MMQKPRGPGIPKSGEIGSIYLPCWLLHHLWYSYTVGLEGVARTTFRHDPLGSLQR